MAEERVRQAGGRESANEMLQAQPPDAGTGEERARVQVGSDQLN